MAAAPGPAPLTDRDALDRFRRRAMAAPADFLHRHAAAEISERLLEVNRTFTAPAIIGPFAPLWTEVLTARGAIPGAAPIPDAEVLDLAEAAHDLVIHALCLHWANDPVGQLIQMRRALRPDGLALAVLFGGSSLSELRAALAEAEVEVTGGLGPRIAPMGEIRDLGALLQRAGLALPVADSLTLTVTYAGLPALLRDLRAMGETNALAARPRRPLRRAVLSRAAEIYARAFPAADDPARIRATAEMICLTGWAPGPGQQQPLRPGSAQARLADALGTAETPLPGPKPGT